MQNNSGSNKKEETWEDWEDAADAGLEPTGLEIVPEEPKKNSTKPKKVEIVNNLSTHTQYVEPIRLLSRPKNGPEKQVNASVVKPTVPVQKDFSERMAEYEKAKERIFNSKN